MYVYVFIVSSSSSSSYACNSSHFMLDSSVVVQSFSNVSPKLAAIFYL